VESQPSSSANKWAAITEFEVWGQDTLKVAVAPESSLSMRPFYQGTATIVIPAQSRFVLPPDACAVDVYDIQGKKIRSFSRISTGTISTMRMPPAIGMQLARIRFTK
jgi:hypothetical protein